MNQRTCGIVSITVVLSCGLSCHAFAQSELQGPGEDGTRPALMNIAGRGLLDSPAYGCITELSDDIGARVTGSPAAQKAIETGSTSAGGVDADVVPVNLFKVENEMNDLAHFRGKVILMRAEGVPQKSLGVLMTQYGAFLRKLEGMEWWPSSSAARAGSNRQGCI